MGRKNNFSEPERMGFAEWFCWVRGINPTKPLKRKLELMFELKKKGINSNALIKKS